MRAKIGGFLRTSVARNALALYGAQFATYLFPLVTVPYLARVLGPEAWGMIVFVQAIALYVALVVEYNFDLSASRDVARSRDEPSKLAAIVSGVVGAKIALATVSLTIMTVAQVFVPQLRDTGWLLWLGAFWWVCVAFRPFWFFLGIERVGYFLTQEITLKAVAVALIVLFVRAPEDAWLVLAFQGAAAAATMIIGLVMAYRVTSFGLPSMTETIKALRTGWSLFIFRASSSLYNMGNLLILGLLAPPHIVAYYAGAERISKIFVMAMLPVVNAIYPKVSSYGRENPSEIARIARITTLTLALLGALGYIVLYFLSPFVVRIILGAGFEESARVLRVLLLLLPILGIVIPLTGHWMIPMGLEGWVTKISLSASLLHVFTAVLLGSQFAHVGAAWALVLTETYVLIVIGFVLVTHQLNPFSRNVLLDKTSVGKTG